VSRRQHRSLPLLFALAGAALVAAPAVAATPSSGCGSSPPSSGNKTISVSGAPGGNRSYELDMPGGYDRNDPYPLLIAYHGTGSDGAQFCGGYYGNFGATVGNDAVIVCPDAEGSSSIDWTESHDLPFFDAMLADLKSKLCIDQDRVFVTGHSAGAGFTHRLGCARGNVIRAIAPVAGFKTGAECSSPVGQVAAIVIHGDADSLVPQSSGESVRDFWIGRNSCNGGSSFNVSPKDCDTHKGYNSCDSGYAVEWCLEQGVDHLDYWSIPTFAGGNPTNLAPPALWNFFTSLGDPTPPVTAIFGDDFESGLGSWASQAGDVSTSGSAANNGSDGLKVGFGTLCSYSKTDLMEQGPTASGTANACHSITTSGAVTVETSAVFNAGALVALANGFSTDGLSAFTASLEPAVIPFSYVVDTTPAALGAYHASFGIDAGTLSSIDTVTDFVLFSGHDAGGAELFRVSFRRHTGPTENRLAIAALSGGAPVEHGSEFLLPSGWHTVEISWSAASGSGEMMLAVDGASLSGLASLDNGGAALESVRLGFVNGEKGSTGGFLSIDDFDSWE